MYILAKTSRCYYGGQGRRDKIYDTILEAAQGAIDDGNPIGFDVYAYELKRKPIGEAYKPILRWHDFPEFFARMQQAEKES